ncbi:plastocyanin/azurin family copper-binding protein [Natrinema sp. HArc-T2]|uniref:plastocyanin/azurin family copper-binding protein n=1 Tax=Natrinema sp. HArc-T2 TaxID=3242701 RepID=UPI00359E3755
MIERRAFLRTAGTVIVGTALAGCSGGDEQNGTDDANGDTGVTDVDVGPEGRLRFEPEEVEITTGETVRWTALSEGHNVTSHPDASPKCENPDGAEPFTSYEGDDHFAIMAVDETFEHEFTVPGEYVYVCTPHAGQGMVGTVIVSE